MSVPFEYVEARSTQLRPVAVERAGVGAFLARLDWVLLAAVAGLVGYGLWAIAGITRHDIDGDPRYFVFRQAVFVAAGAIGLIGLLFIDPDLFRRRRRELYTATLGMMLFVYLAAPYTRGSKRWLDFGFFRFQPSEFGKLLLILFLAGFLADRGRRVGEGRTTLAAVGLAAGPVLLVFVQPDIGTALVYGMALAAVLFVAGTRWSHLALLGAAVAVTALSVLWILPSAGIDVLKPYQVKRLTAFTHPGEDPRGATYNVNQSITAVGAGGLRGRGVAGATQTNLNYLPEHATDFAFASLAEQRGFFGASLLLLLYLLVVWRGLKVVTRARDAFSAAVAGGIVLALLFQIFVNVGMTIGIAPITGIPLPFVSVGGSSMVANLLAVGVLLSIHSRGRPARRGGG
jgi:rod shape determining protein RodA